MKVQVFRPCLFQAVGCAFNGSNSGILLFYPSHGRPVMRAWGRRMNALD